MVLAMFVLVSLNNVETFGTLLKGFIKLLHSSKILSEKTFDLCLIGFDQLRQDFDFRLSYLTNVHC